MPELEIEFDRPNKIPTRTGKCPVCEGRGKHFDRDKHTQRIINTRICRWCGGRGMIGGPI